MKKQKILITLAGLVAVVATSATITAFTLTGDGSSAPAGESAGTQEPAFDVDGPAILDPAPDTIDDGKGGVSVTNPDGTWLKDNPPTDDMTDTPPLHGDPEPLEPVDGTDVPGTPPVIEPLKPGEGSGELVADPTPKDDVDDAGTEVVRVTPALADLEDNLLATGAEVKVSGEVVSEGIFSVDGRVLEVNGERVQVMDYGDSAALEAEAAGISPDGRSVAHNGQASMILWVAAPHFFRTDTTIVLYVGENAKVIEALTSALGPQFAGR